MKTLGGGGKMFKLKELERRKTRGFQKKGIRLKKNDIFDDFTENSSEKCTVREKKKKKEQNAKNQSINHSINGSLNQSINGSINQWINQSMDHSINQSINQLKEYPLCRAKKERRKLTFFDSKFHFQLEWTTQVDFYFVRGR